MGSIGIDNAGNISFGFNAASLNLRPTVLPTRRAATDPLGSMPGPTVIVNGTGVQKNSFDPTDDCTFWYTQEYYKTTGSLHWTTRIASFRFNSCSAHGNRNSISTKAGDESSPRVAQGARPPPLRDELSMGVRDAFE